MQSPRGKRVLGRTPPGRVHYWLPVANGGGWHFDVPRALAKCVGRYARIPEFAARSHLLDCSDASSPTGD